VNERRAFFRELASAAREARKATQPPAPPSPPEAPARPMADPDRLGDAELERYSRQLVLPEWSEAAQLSLRSASVLVIGAGALGSPVATYLAGAGVGRLGIVDDDDVELSNLARQHLHFTPDIGAPKAESAAAKLRFLNPEIVVEPYRVRLDESTAAGLVAGQDLVVDCSDSFATRYVVNAACCAAGVPLVEGGVVGTSGLVMAIRPGETACYRCAFPEPPPPGSVPSCAEAGVLGPAAGVAGSLQALEALKLLTGVGAPLVDAFLQLDLAVSETLRVTVRRREDCPDCGARTL
jgi:molybdopterin/thiamine biosynthesis adenylyltransferase